VTGDGVYRMTYDLGLTIWDLRSGTYDLGLTIYDSSVVCRPGLRAVLSGAGLGATVCEIGVLSLGQSLEALEILLHAA
jgi:hypothetical protein